MSKNACLGVDIGNLTCIGVGDFDIIVESRLKEYDEMDSFSTEDIFDFEGIKYVVNNGKYENHKIKYEKSNYLPLLYYIISKCTSENNVDLVLAIPASQYRGKKEIMKKFIIDNSKKTITVNEEKRTIKINNIFIAPEGYSLKTLSTIVSKVKKNINSLIIDIGGSSVDLGEFDENFNFKGGNSIDYALLDLYRETRDYINDNYDLKISLEEGKKYFDGDMQLIDGNIEYKKDLMQKFLKNIINELKGMYPNLANSNIVLSGGGAEKIYNTFKKIYPQTILDENIKSQARGLYNIGLKIFK